MEVADFYCGAGGLSAGAILSGNKVRVGVDMDSTALRHWAANTSGRAECVEIVPGEGENLPWPTPHKLRELTLQLQVAQVPPSAPSANFSKFPLYLTLFTPILQLPSF